MDLLNKIDDFNLSEDSIALCIGLEVNEGIGSHIGILYPNEDGKHHFLHLAFHCILRDDFVKSINQQYKWVKLEVDELLIQPIIGWCHIIFENHKTEGIPYGLKNTEAYFNDMGKLNLGDNEHGLSCSTFVLKLLERSNVHLLSLRNWPSANYEDVMAQERLIKLLKKYAFQLSIKKEHIAKISSESGCIRIRPEHVVAGGMSKVYPIDYDEAFLLGEKIIENLDLP